MAISTGRLLNSLKRMEMENSVLEERPYELEKIEEEAEDKNSLTMRLEQLMNSEKMINQRLQTFDQKYRYFNQKENSVKKQPKRNLDNVSIHSTIKSNSNIRTARRKTGEKNRKIDLYKDEFLSENRARYANKSDKKALSMTNRYRKGGMEGKRRGKYPNYMEVARREKQKKRKKSNNFVPSNLEDVIFDDEGNKEDLEPENLDIEMEKKPQFNPYFSKFNSSQKMHKPKQLSMKLSDLSAIENKLDNQLEDPKSPQSTDHSFLKKEDNGSCFLKKAKNDSRFFSTETQSKKIKKSIKNIGIFRFENTSQILNTKHSHLGIGKCRTPGARPGGKKSNIRISSYIKNISREKNLNRNRSGKKVKGFHDLNVIERNDLWLKAKIKRANDMKTESKERKPGFQPTFASKKYADKLGINKSMMKSRKSISWRRGPPMKSGMLSTKKRDNSYMSVKSGKSFSRAIRESRSYGQIHRVRQEYLDDKRYQMTGKVLE